MTDRP